MGCAEANEKKDIDSRDTYGDVRFFMPTKQTATGERQRSRPNQAERRQADEMRGGQ
jgi:hypothetical protein